MSACGDRDFDGCREWGPAVACQTGSCQAGACAASCVDECTTGVCEGNTFVACGQYDSDPCKDQGAPQACAAASACGGQMCTATGCKAIEGPREGTRCDDGNSCTSDDTCRSGRCAGTGLACQTPPAPSCRGTYTVRTYATRGECRAGECAYDYVDTLCERGRCEAGACKTCETPAHCDDGDACTTDTCQAGGVCRHSATDVDEDGVGPGACGGDCDDNDAQVHPQARYASRPRANGSFDYNCDGGIEPELTVMATCRKVGSRCKMIEGFKTVPACGVVGEWLSLCEPSSASPTGCTVRYTARQQRCR